MTAELEWYERPDGVWEVRGLAAEVQVRFSYCGEGWRWVCFPGDGGLCETLDKAQIAALGVYQTYLQGRRDQVAALLTKTKRAAQDADDAALVAAHGEVAE